MWSTGSWNRTPAKDVPVLMEPARREPDDMREAQRQGARRQGLIDVPCERCEPHAAGEAMWRFETHLPEPRQLIPRRCDVIIGAAAYTPQSGMEYFPGAESLVQSRRAFLYFADKDVWTAAVHVERSINRKSKLRDFGAARDDLCRPGKADGQDIQVRGGLKAPGLILSLALHLKFGDGQVTVQPQVTFDETDRNIH